MDTQVSYMKTMARSRAVLIFAVLVIIVPASGGPRGASPDQNGGILAAIRANAARVYSAYEGVEARRSAVSRVYDSRSGKLIESAEVLLIRREYFRRRPEYTALRYVKNGEELPPEKYGYRTRDPIHLPFDVDHDANYRERVAGTAVVEGVRCYEIELIPRQKTARHFSGHAFFAVDGLALRYLEGTLADNPFGVKSLKLRLYFRSLGEAAVVERGEYDIDVHVPVLYPHRRIVHSFTSSEDRLIPKKSD